MEQQWSDSGAIVEQQRSNSRGVSSSSGATKERQWTDKGVTKAERQQELQWSDSRSDSRSYSGVTAGATEAAKERQKRQRSDSGATT